MTAVAALALCACALAALAAPSAAAPAEKQYESRLAGLDVDKILNNDRTLNNYVKCMVDKGPCTAEGKEIKKILPEVLATNCAKCSPQLRTNLKKTVIAMRTKHPQQWQQVVDKFDPKRIHAKEMEKFLQS